MERAVEREEWDNARIGLEDKIQDAGAFKTVNITATQVQLDNYISIDLDTRPAGQAGKLIAKTSKIIETNLTVGHKEQVIYREVSGKSVCNRETQTIDIELQQLRRQSLLQQPIENIMSYIDLSQVLTLQKSTRYNDKQLSRRSTIVFDDNKLKMELQRLRRGET